VQGPYTAGVPVCPRCGEDNPERARFCLACGSPLVERTTPHPEVRKSVTIVFTDVSGSTAMGDRLDPESLRRVMTRYFDAMRGVLERHGGTVEKFIGDAVMAVFGVPILHEDDALRAVRAAAEMRDTLEQLNGELEQEWGIGIRTRTGVNTGEVVAGDPTAGQSLVVGDAVNVAARLEQSAAPGEILIGPATHRLIRDAVVVEPIDPLSLKGKADPVAAFRLIEVLPEAPRSTRRLHSPMVGREGEQTLLWQAFDRTVRDRTCHLFTILGSAGVGKSRLAEEVTSVCRFTSTVISGRCLSYGEGITYRPVTEAVRSLTGITEEDAPGDTNRKVEALLGDEPDATLVAERVAQLFGLPGAADAEETAWAVRRFLESLARSSPLIVVLDDIHWGEPTFLDLVEYVAEWSRDAPILLVCLARPELLDVRPGWGGGKLNATSIHLEPLTEAESSTLITNLLGTVDLAEEARATIAGASEGNPLFLEEMLAMLIDDGLLREHDGRWVPSGRVSEVRAPPTIQALLAARLDRLDREERAVIERASVEGKVFHQGAVVDLTSEAARPRVAAHLQGLVRKELVRPTRAEFGGQEAFSFRHLLIREAAYQGMPKDLRAVLHQRFAEWLERTSRDWIAEYEEIVGYHLEQAFRYRRELGQPDDAALRLATRAAERLGSAGRRAFARGDGPGAAKLLERATSLLPPHDPLRLALSLELAETLIDRGELARAVGLLEELAEAGTAAGDEHLEWMARVDAEIVRVIDMGEGELAQAISTARRAIEAFEATDDSAGLSKAWQLLGMAGWIEARMTPAEEAFERATEYARRAGDRRREIENLGFLASMAGWGPLPASKAIEACDRIVARAGGHRRVEALALVASGHQEAIRGRPDVGRELVARGRSILRELGLHTMEAATTHAAGMVEYIAGDLEAAERLWREGYRALERMGERAYLSTSAAHLAQALCALGRFEEAERFTRISEDAADARDLASQVQWRGARALVESHAGNEEAALRLLDDAILMAEDTSYVDTLADTLVIRAEVRARGGNRAGAADDLRRAIDLADRKEYLPLRERAAGMLSSL
jgi:class 3 adenylate cyclase/tetratricopeptide (TPR) repeat protein